MSCIRCGRDVKTDNHHDIQRIDGGSDDKGNIEKRCQPCHHYEHKRRDLIDRILGYVRLGKLPQAQLNCYRLDVLDRLNTPEAIRVNGVYTSYWVDEATHSNTKDIWNKFNEEKKNHPVLKSPSHVSYEE